MRLEERNDVTQLTSTLYRIEGPNGSKFPFCAGYLFLDQATVLIDAGLGEAKLKEIDAAHPIDTLIISHSHSDHILSWHLLSDRRILIPKETPEMGDLEAMGRRFTGSEDKGAYWAKVVGRPLGLRPLREPDGRFGNRSVLKMGATHLEAIHSPGHLVDHYCFFDRNSGIMLSTDIDFTSFGPWYGNAECDIGQFKNSVRRIMKFPTVKFCPSHMPPVSENTEAALAGFLEGFDRHRRTILELCSPPRSLQKMASLSPFYRNRMPDKVLQRIFEEPMIMKNLELLLREGVIEEKFGHYRRVD